MLSGYKTLRLDFPGRGTGDGPIFRLRDCNVIGNHFNELAPLRNFGEGQSLRLVMIQKSSIDNSQITRRDL